MKLRYIMPAALAMALVATLGGCKATKQLYQKYETPKDGLVGEYGEAVKQPVDSQALGNLSWQEVFTDPLLRSYIDSALANNNDLQNAKINIDIAQARLQGAKLAYLPSVVFTPNGAGTKLGSNGMDWGWQLPLTVSWEADIFGKITNNKRSAESAVRQSEDYRQAVQSQIIASVATCYYTLVSLQNQLNIYNETAKLWGETVETMKRMKESGGYTEVAVVQSQANYYSVLANIPEIKLNIAQTCNTLSLLLNTKPQQWAVNDGSRLTMPGKFDKGIPMSYLAARPDVHSAEETFAQAYYATNIARAAFYPSLTLTASGAYGTLLGSTVLDPAKWLINLAGSLSQTIFSRGQNLATYKAAKLQQQQALNNFSYSILNASREVSNAMLNIQAVDDKIVNVEKQEDNLAKAVEYNKDLLALSTTTYLEVLTAQQSLLAAQIQLESLKLSSNQGVINLYQSLGGGR